MCGALRVLSAGSAATEGPREGKSRSKVKSTIKVKGTIKCKHCNADSCTNLAFLAAAHGCFPSRSEEHTSELQSLMRISYAVFCLKKKNTSQQLSRPQSQHSIRQETNTPPSLHTHTTTL